MYFLCQLMHSWMICRTNFLPLVPLLALQSNSSKHPPKHTSQSSYRLQFILANFGFFPKHFIPFILIPFILLEGLGKVLFTYFQNNFPNYFHQKNHCSAFWVLPVLFFVVLFYFWHSFGPIYYVGVLLMGLFDVTDNPLDFLL